MPPDLIEPHPDLRPRAGERCAGPTPAWPPCGTAPPPPSRSTDNAAQEVDAAIAKAHLNHRLRSLSPDVPGLSFGRLDEETGDTWYVGRRHVEDDRGDPVVVDWRAPVSTPFYRATATDPLGPAPAPPVPDDRHRARRPLRRGLRRPRQRCTPPTATWAASPTRCWPSSSAPAPAPCATSWRRSRPSRTS